MKVTNASFTPSSGVVYVAVCKTGREKDKLVRAVLCTANTTQQVENSSDYELYRTYGDPISQHTNALLDLTLKDSSNVITVGVPEQAGDYFPVLSEGLPIVFSLN